MSSIIRGLLGVINHEDLHRTFLRFESETELLLEECEDRKTRGVGVPEAILARLRAYIELLSANGPGAWLFPSTTLITLEWPENAMKNRIRPRLANAGYHWLNFAVLRYDGASAGA
jgi:hypothetical protein